MIQKIKRIIALILYKTIASKMPLSNAKYSFGSKKLRRCLVKHMIDHIGKETNIERKAVIGSNKIWLGDYSGIGVKCEILGPVYIGNNVLMGPEVVIYTRNHAYENKDILIQKQGYKSINPVKIRK